MKKRINALNILLLGLFILVLQSCMVKPGDKVDQVDSTPNIYPDYKEVTFPQNIASLNFMVEEPGDHFFVEIKGDKTGTQMISSKTGKIQVPLKDWKKLTAQNESLEYQVSVEREGEWYQYKSFRNHIAKSNIDPFLYYRLLYPGYESWSEISIMQRSLENFKEKAVVKNNVVDQNCVNCHAFNQQNPENFMFHMRGSMGGTYFVSEDELVKFNLKTREMKNGAVYPRWHPSGKFVAFSSNKVVQRFHSMHNKKIEVSDLNSSLVLYDLEKNEMSPIEVDKEGRFMDTYPEWSPDGKYLYFCRATQIDKEYDYEEIKYNLYRVAFDRQNKTFAQPELIVDAESKGKSISFPRISPDGKQLVYTYHDYGCFPIWHKEADLYAVNLDNLMVRDCNVNSDFTESYHSWSFNGSWMIFSSKRGDGLTARPYISYVSDNGEMHKPFVLPQEDPVFYKEFIKTFNIPELSRTEVSFSPGHIRKAAASNAVQANWAENN